MAELISLKDSNNNVGIVRGLSDTDLLALNSAQTTLATLSNWGGGDERFIMSSTEPASAEDGKVWVSHKTKVLTDDISVGTNTSFTWSLTKLVPGTEVIFRLPIYKKNMAMNCTITVTATKGIFTSAEVEEISSDIKEDSEITVTATQVTLVDTALLGYGTAIFVVHITPEDCGDSVSITFTWTKFTLDSNPTTTYTVYED